MARDSRLRPHESESPARTGRFALPQSISRVHVVAILTIMAAAFVAVWQFAGLGGDRSTGSSAFLTKTLGAPQRSVSLVRNPAPGLQVAVDPSAGYTVSHGNDRVSLSPTRAGSSHWRGYANGYSRPTPFGHETITVDPRRTEQFLTVDRHLGKRTWEWNLGLDTMTPRILPNGSVVFLAGGQPSGLRLLPAAILALEGATITPAGLGWKLKKRKGSWRLRLTVDDSKLPVPYLIDPAIAYGFQTEATSSSGSFVLNKPYRTVQNDVMIAQITAPARPNRSRPSPRRPRRCRRPPSPCRTR